MDENSTSPCILGISLISLLLFFSTVCGSRTIDSGIPNCPNTDCGNGVSITYPFWVSDPSTQPTSYCGYQGSEFNITCDGSTPLFRAYTHNYAVKAINATAHTVSLVDTDAVGLYCPKARSNVTISGLPLISFSAANSYLLFFFNCDSYSGPSIPEENRATCLKNATGHSYVFNGTDPPGRFWGLYGACVGGTVLSPVLRRPLLASDFGTAMNGGFELVWRDSEMQSCMRCEESGGRCGYGNDNGRGSVFRCLCVDGLHLDGVCGLSPSSNGKNSNEPMKIVIGVGTIIITLALSLIMFCIFKHCMWVNSFDDSSDQNVEAFLTSHGPLAVRRYRYSEVKQMTASRSVKLGQGGYGTVYKGTLQDGTLVAVKLLKDTKGTGEEFINEVASIGRTNHVNVVSLLGYCSERANRALIYEYMPNGSLEKFLFIDDPNTTTSLGWDQLHKIALGIARGLEYLHRGCNTRMVHFDIKPHNILLDEDFCPKISDFGLAKLYKPAESVFSTVCVRGTAGYIAPEVFSRNFGVVSSKSDVYSYGMMVLEMVGRRRNVNTHVQNTSELYFPHWIYEHLDDDCYRQACRITVESEEIARKMILVGLWCIQTNPSSRPSISKVVEMLEGSADDLEIPPKPYMCSPEKSSHMSDIDSFPTMSGSL